MAPTDTPSDHVVTQSMTNHMIMYLACHPSQQFLLSMPIDSISQTYLTTLGT
uniref:Uncharacterized protein n=1 Tax=Arundo donax TaxID=35708 RepID=A0A0A9BQZ5_ARUDO